MWRHKFLKQPLILYPMISVHGAWALWTVRSIVNDEAGDP